MDFFEHQEQARRQTGVLIVYFALALVGIIAATYFLAIAVLTITGDNKAIEGNAIWRPEVLTGTATITTLVVFLASAFKTMQLSSGGAVVARELGGRELDSNTIDIHERRLLNIVEEMAIASGVPVPTVYVMDSEDSINAFAAGKTTSDAVIGVTRGCMTILTRDELQGVIAHEFSHILNGDMRLNIRLMGLLFGILFLALMGELLMRSTFYGRVSSSRREGGGAVVVMLIAGIGLLLIGYVGSFFARLIKASISRQREFLADSSAVQFTRNPEGLAGALMKIGGLSEGSTITHPMAKDASHLFFGNAIPTSILATHPPLQVRIQRLIPSWTGSYDPVSSPPIAETQISQSSSKMSELTEASSFLTSGHSSVRLTKEEATESFRSLHPEQVDLGVSVHRMMPDHWSEMCRNPAGAQTMVFALLLAQDNKARDKELALLGQSMDESTVQLVSRLFGEIHSAHSTIKLSLVDLAIPSLRHLSQGEYQRFRNLTNQLISSDIQIDLFEFTLLQMVTRHLDMWFGERRPPRIKYRSLNRLTDEAGILLSTLAALSHPDDESISRAAFAEATSSIEAESKIKIPFKSGSDCGLNRIEEALKKFDRATPLIKRQLLEACTRSVLADGAVSSREAELIRAIGDAIGCAIPPFVRTAPLV
tara:strand:+ start:2075 stop:4030 length:1956 start_codon:yes stop_codon:yes gene_type:complete